MYKYFVSAKNYNIISINSLNIVLLILCSFHSVNNSKMLMTDVFEVIIDSPIFNWTYEGISRHI